VQDFTTDRELLRKSIKAWSIPVDWRPTCGTSRTGATDHLGPGMKCSNALLLQQTATAPTPFFSAAVDRWNSPTRQGAISALDSLRIIGEKLAGLPGRKNLIWVTPGFPYEDPGTWTIDRNRPVIEQLNDANVALNAIDIRGWPRAKSMTRAC